MIEVALSLGACDQPDHLVLEVSPVGKNAVGISHQAPVGESQHRPPGFWTKAISSIEFMF